ncbi:putative transcription factor bHLH041 [Phoenix dactylifera]|uniref:Transcription factor bHLH041 n=1 Tax=Phoenix dactylifera TaxID=42345 RepID=A0A8B7MSW3_PHODC|nr:putative transcription factor bHLH041 [Phoenix dactylifera]
MDSVFLLSADDRRRFLQSAARILGCSYICLWTALPRQSKYVTLSSPLSVVFLPSKTICPLYHLILGATTSISHLASIDGWHREDDSSHPSSSSGSLSRRLFEAYRNLRFSIDSGCVPGSAYKEGIPYIELGESELMNSASMQIQRRFYQEARIKTAIFMGCSSGEIELGMTMSDIMYAQTNIQHVFSEDFVQHSLLGDPFPAPDQSKPSSSSSSLRSLSVGSPEYSGAPFMPEMTGEQALVVPPHQMTMQAYARYRDVQLPTPASDDAALTRAMLAVLSTPSSSSPLFYQSLRQDQAQHSPRSRPVGSFQAYNPAFAPILEPQAAVHGQKMVKTAISILRRIHHMRYQTRMQEVRPTSNQLHHMISERRRREKLNESFHALRMLLPPSSKKDKASVLSNTREYVNTLKAQISELEERNRMLEMQLQPAVDIKEVGDSTERVEVQITRASESTSEAQRMNLIITVRVECNMIDLVLRIVERLKEMGNISLVSVEASSGSPQTNSFARSNFTLQVQVRNIVSNVHRLFDDINLELLPNNIPCDIMLKRF